jgi:hypothetical protein
LKEIKFGIFGEDEAHQIFLQNYFKNFKNENISFVESDKFKRTIKGDSRPKKKVFNELSSVAKIAYSKYYLQLLIVVVDADTFSENKTDREELSKILRPLIKNDNGKGFLICIPVQCIEHWAWYLKEEYGQTDSIESQSNKDAKKAVYGSARFNKQTMTTLLENLTKTLPINELIIKSKSFLKFHTDVEKFCKNQIAQFPN